MAAWVNEPLELRVVEKLALPESSLPKSSSIQGKQCQDLHSKIAKCKGKNKPGATRYTTKPYAEGYLLKAGPWVGALCRFLGRCPCA